MSLSTRVRHGSGWTGRLVATLAAMLVVGGGASASSAQGPPGSSPANPITQSGRPATIEPIVDVRWSDNTVESIPLGTFPASTRLQDLGSVAQAAIAARARAEGRIVPSIPPMAPPAASRTPQAAHRQRITDSDGVYWCALSDGTPFKDAGEVWSQVEIVCSTDVEGTAGTLFLYRGAGYTLIGEGYSSGGPDTVYGAVGTCASSTWQYNSHISYTMETPSGDFDFDHDWGPAWISC